MKKVFILFITILFLSCGSLQHLDKANEDAAWEIIGLLDNGNEYTIAINYFLEGDQITELSKYIQNSMTIAVSNAAAWDELEIKVVSRQFLDQIIKEQKFQLSGFADQTTQTQIGKLLGADIIITGTISATEDEEIYVINAQLIETETGIVKRGFVKKFWTEDF